MIRTFVFMVVLAAALAFFASSVRRLVATLRLGRSENRFDRPGDRLRNVLVVAFGQSKLLREPLAGLTHFLIFWGFVVLLSAILEAIAEGLFPALTLERLGPLFPVMAALQETVGLLVFLAVVVGLMRWYIVPPRRYFGPEITGHVRLDATLILCLIALIVAATFGTNAARMASSGHASEARFASIRLVWLFASAGNGPLWFEVFWWAHILLVLGFLNYLPYSKHLHVLTSIPNVYFASLRPRGELPALSLEDEGAEKFGADDVRELTWKQLLDGFSCTDCGRCTAACPASLTGKPLSPRKIIMSIRERTTELASALREEAAEQHRDVAEHRLVDNFVTDAELWACTTCRACMEECPVMIEHVPTIIDMRRFLVLSESRFPEELTTTFKNLEVAGNPWGFASAGRAEWAEGSGIRKMAQVEGKVEVLFWVGCAGAYDARYQKVSRAMARLMRAAGVDFAILGEEEKCNGDPARRAGNEYLAQMLMSENVETLKQYEFDRIVATCPHCFNTLKNEYPQFGGKFKVVHHTEFLNNLLLSGRLRVSKRLRERITFHDSCYIGRYNGIYEAPRALLRRSGASLLEMRRSRDRGFCCGAGGARMFMEEKTGKRVNVERTEEAIALRPPTIATACPFCMTMMADGLKAKDADEKVRVRDVAEVLADTVQ